MQCTRNHPSAWNIQIQKFVRIIVIKDTNVIPQKAKLFHPKVVTVAVYSLKCSFLIRNVQELTLAYGLAQIIYYSFSCIVIAKIAR